MKTYGYELVGASKDRFLVFKVGEDYKCYHPDQLTMNVLLTISTLGEWDEVIFFRDSFRPHAVDYLYRKASKLPLIDLNDLPGERRTYDPTVAVKFVHR